MAVTYKHLVIVHGIGDQAPNETSVNFMNNFLRALPEGPEYSLKVHNLITTVDPPGGKQKFRPAYAEFTYPGGQCVIGFSEVFWQNITNHILKDFHRKTPVPMFVWAHSLNTRMMGADFYRARDVISNLESLLGIANKLAVIFKHADLFVRVLNQFVGDVQMYAESADIRNQVDADFERVIARVEEDAANAGRELEIDLGAREIYVIAHSEGTLVSYSSLVRAAVAKASWLPLVKALVTLGSPIDKHFGIWPTRFLQRHQGLATLEPRIPWWNFWDISDPVGYGMRSLMSDDNDEPTDAERIFELRYDSGFARYPLPGAAHVAYWTDQAIHEQIIDQAMGLGTTRSSTDVRSRPLLPTLQPIGDWGAYLLGRGVEVALMLYFLTRLASPLPDAGPALDWLKPEAAGDWLVFAGLLTGPLIVCKLLWEVYKAWGKVWLWVRGTVFVAWLGLLGMSAWALRTPAELEAKDVIGYGTGLLVTILGWQLHTRVHKGIVQMWRYTKGVHTSAAKGWRDPGKVKVRETTTG